MNYQFTFFFVFTSYILSAQVGINTENPTETLDIDGTLRVREINTQGVADDASNRIMVFDTNGVVKWVNATVVVAQGGGNPGSVAVLTDGTIITGDGTTGNEITLGQQGASTGQILQWNGTSWIPTNVTSLETLTSLTDNNNGTITYKDENGIETVINKTKITDNGNGSFSFNDGSGLNTFIPIAEGTKYSNTTSNLIAVNVQDAIDELVTSLTTVQSNLAMHIANDGDLVLGNEITNASDGTLTRNGSGTNSDPYTLDVSLSGIATAELADDAVTSAKIEDDAIDKTKIAADVAGTGLTQNADGSLEIDPTDITLNGDVTGTLAATKVEKIQNIDVSSTAPTNGQALVFNGTAWVPTTVFESTLAEIFDATGGQVINEGTFTDINFATEGIVDDDYTTTTNSIQVTNAGRYEITYRVSIDSDINNRTGGEFHLDVNGSEVAGTKAFNYSRNELVGANTVTVTKVVDLLANSIVKVKGQVYASNQNGTSATVQMATNGSSLIVKRIK